LDSSFGEQLRGIALGSSFRKQLWTTFRNNFLFEKKRLSGFNFLNYVGEQFLILILRVEFEGGSF
jgi:hypothetical protein